VISIEEEDLESRILVFGESSDTRYFQWWEENKDVSR